MYELDPESFFQQALAKVGPLLTAGSRASLRTLVMRAARKVQEADEGNPAALMAGAVAAMAASLFEFAARRKLTVLDSIGFRNWLDSFCPSWPWC